VAFGVGRYQPHTAAEVLANGYGDCKDKHTLLETMLAAAGLKAYPALIGFGIEMDSEVPSPTQFNHVITYVPLGSRVVWLDSTSEVAPFGMLLAGLRDKEALVMAGAQPAVTKTPANLPVKDFQVFHVDGKLSEEGTLTAKMDMQTRGDAEVGFRYAFRQVGQPQWQELAQRISDSMGYAGRVADVSPSKPEDTGEPFRLQYSYIREDYPDWQNHRLTAALPSLGLPHYTEEQRKCPSMPFSDSLDITMVGNIEVPAGYSAEIPEPVSINKSFARYKASYTFANGILHVERHLTTSAKQLSNSDLKAYNRF
jgi:hypothetical protein